MSPRIILLTPPGSSEHCLCPPPVYRLKTPALLFIGEGLQSDQHFDILSDHSHIIEFAGADLIS